MHGLNLCDLCCPAFGISVSTSSVRRSISAPVAALQAAPWIGSEMALLGIDIVYMNDGHPVGLARMGRASYYEDGKSDLRDAAIYDAIGRATRRVGMERYREGNDVSASLPLW